MKEMKSLISCGHSCLTYTTPDGEYDVAAYDPRCPIHGWRWDFTGAILSLAEAETEDLRHVEALK